jgi:predicted  nucleic acid-binding Zn-ribbon protein
VYEKRVDELLEEVRNLQDRSEDVDTVAQQLKQLEELVAELEEGLEDARRGEAEARGEVEFLRGEVERSRSELRRERERLKTEDQLNGGGSYSSADEIHDLENQLSAKDDEIRGLKVIINNLNANSPKQPNGNIHSVPGHQRNESTMSEDVMLQQIRELESIVQQKSAHEEELANEVKHLRNSVTLSKFPMPASPFGLHTAMRSPHSRGGSEDLDKKHLSTGTVQSQKTVVLNKARGSAGQESTNSWHDAPATPGKNNMDTLRERSDDGVTDISNSESAVLWCEICEEGGHDILTCGNMFGPGKKNEHAADTNGSPRKNIQQHHDNSNGNVENEDPDRPRPLVSRKSTTNSFTSTHAPPDEDLPPPPTLKDDHRSISPEPFTDSTPTPIHNTPANPATAAGGKPKIIEGIGAQAGMYAGRTTGVIDPEKWCALCERDGHDSLDCPVEEDF